MPAPRLISITANAELTILRIARVSSNQDNTDPGLLKYLIRNKHWSPFEMAHMVIEIETSRAIATQILRHRSFSFQEFSQRYADATKTIKYVARRQAETNRQSSIDDLDEETKAWWEKTQYEIETIAFDTYEEAISKGVAKECARMILPLSTATTLYMSGTIRSWIHYLEQRCDEHTQLEHREIANEIKVIFTEWLPIISEALGW